MKREAVKEMRITQEEVRLIMANRKKRRIRYMKKLKRRRRSLHLKKAIANKLYPIPQRLGGAGLMMGGMIAYRTAASFHDGELAFTGFLVLLLGIGVALAKENLYNQ